MEQREQLAWTLFGIASFFALVFGYLWMRKPEVSIETRTERVEIPKIIIQEKVIEIPKIEYKDRIIEKSAYPTEEEIKGEGVKVVKEFHDLQVRQLRDPSQRTEKERMSLISQEFIESKGIDRDLWRFDSYTFDEYSILGVDRFYVRVKQFSRARGNYRIFTYRLTKENGKLVIFPSSSEGKDVYFKPEGGIGEDLIRSITPWWTVGPLSKSAAQ